MQARRLARRGVGAGLAPVHPVILSFTRRRRRRRIYEMTSMSLKASELASAGEESLDAGAPPTAVCRLESPQSCSSEALPPPRG